MQATTRKTRILDVVYNASNNELVSTLSAEVPRLALASFLRAVYLQTVLAESEFDHHLFLLLDTAKCLSAGEDADSGEERHCAD